MDNGVIIQWLKGNGDEVKEGDLLLEVESDKSVVEVEAVRQGFLHIVHGPQDGSIPVGEVIAYLLAQGEEPPVESLSGKDTTHTAAVTADTIQPTVEKTHPDVHHQRRLRVNRPPSTPAARRRARELGIDWRLATPTGPRAEVKVRDVERLAENLVAESQTEASADVQISPVARRLAESVGLDIAMVAQRFPGKRLEREEVEDTIRHLIQITTAAESSPAAIRNGNTAQRQPASRLRQLIAGRMGASARTYAPVTLTTQVDATQMVRIRKNLKAEAQATVVPSYNAMITWLVARALVAFPNLNASLEGDEILLWEQINIGIAVDTNHGLVVPVFRNVQAKSIAELSQEMAALLPRAKQGKATPDELTGGTFTITNLGAYEIDAFTPLINPPESAVLGIGRLKAQQVIIEGEPMIRTMMSLSLTFDHRLIDGAPAARFLQQVKHMIERPHLWIV
jgi:pyruvate dehydrogenase E2 component (dihydrolipoamide acetyltransferase)